MADAKITPHGKHTETEKATNLFEDRRLARRGPDDGLLQNFPG
jgi:hypothetical protein